MLADSMMQCIRAALPSAQSYLLHLLWESGQTYDLMLLCWLSNSTTTTCHTFLRCCAVCCAVPPCRQLSAGDQLRVIYENLSKDPNSLANLDQVNPHT